MARRWQIINDNWAIRLKGHYLNRLIYSSAFVFPLPPTWAHKLFLSLVRQQLPSQIRRRKWLAGWLCKGLSLSGATRDDDLMAEAPRSLSCWLLDFITRSSRRACWLGCKKSRPAISINYLIKPSESIHPVWTKRGGTARARRRS